MFKDRALAQRAPFLPLLVLGLAVIGCAPGLHTVRLRTADGQVRTTVPPPRPPLVLKDEQVHQAIQVLARKVVPVADPVEFARQRFEVPIRGGVYVFSARTKQLRPLDAAAAEREDLPPELVEQARGYLQWCRNIHKQGDCLQVLRTGGVLDAHGRYAVAMAIAQGSTIEATKDSLKGMVNPDAVMAMLVSGMTMYMMLWVLPEPVSKGIAAAMTIVLVAYVGVDTLYTLGRGWKRLVDDADKATTFEELQKAGEGFAKVMGADTARVLVMLATAAMGSQAAGMAKVGPTLPGAAQASRLAVAEGSVALELVGSVESVTIAESGLTIALAPGAVAMSSTSEDFGRGGPRVQVVRPNTPSTWGAPTTLEDHFQRHGGDFGARSPEEYSRMAADFFRRAKSERLPTKVDQYGVIRSYDPGTNTFGAYNPDGTARTFFKPTRGTAYWADQPGDLL